MVIPKQGQYLKNESEFSFNLKEQALPLQLHENDILDIMFQNNDDAILFCDGNWNILKANKKAREKLDLNEQQDYQANFIGMLDTQQQNQLYSVKQDVVKNRGYAYCPVFFSNDKSNMHDIIKCELIHFNKTDMLCIRFVNLAIQERVLEVAENLLLKINPKTGPGFFDAIILQLHLFLNADYVLIGELIYLKGEKYIRTISNCVKGTINPNFEYKLDGTPCSNVIQGKKCAYTENVFESFPNDLLLDKMGVQAYIGVPVRSPEGEPLAILVAMYKHPVNSSDFVTSALQYYASNVAAEIQHMKQTQKYVENERKYHLLFNKMENGFVVLEVSFDTDMQAFGYSVKEFNPAFEAICGYSYNDIIAQNLQLTLPQEKFIPFEEINNIALSGEMIKYHVFQKETGRHYDINAFSPVKNFVALVFHDVTEKINSNKELENTIQRYYKQQVFLENIYNGVNSAIFVFDIDPQRNIRFTTNNSLHQKLTGLSHDEIYGKRIEEIRSNETNYNFSTLHEKLKDCIRTGESLEFEEHYQGQSTDVYLLTKLNPVKNTDGIIEQIIGVSTDISLRIRAERALFGSEEKLRNIFNSTSDAIIITDDKGTIIDVNQQVIRFSRLEKPSILNAKIFDLYAIGDDEKILNYLRNIIQNGYDSIQVSGKNRDEKVFFDLHGKKIHYPDREVILHVLRDITSSKETEKKVLNAIIKTEEKERSRFAKDLHDGLGPLLSMMKILFQWLSEPQSPEKKKMIVDKGFFTIDSAIKGLKEISNNISPYVLENFGFLQALRIFIDSFYDNNDISIHLHAQINKRFEKNIEVTLYRTITELINNTLKHANARHVNIQIKEGEQLLTVDYTDDGKGFDVNEALRSGKGMGLFNMKNRIRLLGGKITFSSKPSGGIMVYIEINLKK